MAKIAITARTYKIMHLKLLFEAIIAPATAPAEVQQCTIAHSTRSPYLNEILSALAGLLQPIRTRDYQVPAAVFQLALAPSPHKHKNEQLDYYFRAHFVVALL